MVILVPYRQRPRHDIDFPRSKKIVILFLIYDTTREVPITYSAGLSMRRWLVYVNKYCLYLYHIDIVSRYNIKANAVVKCQT